MMMLQDEDLPDIFDDEDDDDELFVLPGMVTERLIYQIGSLPVPDWFMAGVGQQKILINPLGCDVLVNHHYLHAPVGYYVIQQHKQFTIESPWQNQ